MLECFNIIELTLVMVGYGIGIIVSIGRASLCI